MTLSHTAGYAISAMAFLASRSDAGLCEGSRIADGAEVPPRFLSKILHSLGRGGLVKAVRGTAGGYRLARPSEQVPLSSVLDILGENFHGDRFVRCFPGCTPERPCRFHGNWDRLAREFARVLETTTIADLANLTDEGSRTDAQPEGKKNG